MPVNPFGRPPANLLAAEAGYCAPYLHLLDEDEVGQANRPPTTFIKRKFKSVMRAIRAGHGQGRGDAYSPWIRIRRNFSSPVSKQIFDSVGIKAGNHHFLSSLEFHTALVMAFLGADELRECLPLWPTEHPHPNNESSDQGVLVPGLIDVAREAGIDHGFYVGTTIPYIASLDLLFLARIRKERRLLGISCKPAQITLQSARARERIELDRRYCGLIGAYHLHEDGTSFDQTLVRQLVWLRPLTSEIRAHRGSSQLHDFASWFDQLATERIVHESIVAAGRRVGMNLNTSFLFFRLGIWLHLIDINVALPVRMMSPVKRGRDRVLARLRARYWGGDDD